ncbi:YgjV family protein [Ideonella sp. BN130291]|uniref:YgjV family protein n=1 Tax=Ideonella sp. BN130291 TaxID=3112940 RepID=UPI002E25B1A5|nr:YgjV family protein [Ideonella sp. BN130291]
MLSTELFVHATGLAALAVNVLSLLCRCDMTLRRRSMFAGCLWTLNHVLLGAHSAAALTVVSISRTATSATTLDGSRVARRNIFLVFIGITLAVSAATWGGWASAVTLLAAIMSTYAMFYMRGARLRLSMLAGSLLWMVNAWQYGSWEQMAANLLTACAAVYGAWTLRGVDASNDAGKARGGPAATALQRQAPLAATSPSAGRRWR